MRLKSGDRHLVIGRYGITIEYHRARVGGGTYVRDFETWRYPWLPEATKRERRLWAEHEKRANDSVSRLLGLGEKKQ